MLPTRNTESIWYFNDDQLHNYSPSRKDGVSFEDEMDQRELGILLIRESGISLQLDIEVIATAMIIFQRFYCSESLISHPNVLQVAAGCIFISSKCKGDAPRKLGDIVTVFHYIKTQPKPEILPISDLYWKEKDTLLEMEKKILCAILFDLDIDLPYRWIISFSTALQCSPKIIQFAWNLCSESFCSLIFLKYSSRDIAISCIDIAATTFKIILPNRFDKPWYEIFGITFNTYKK